MNPAERMSLSIFGQINKPEVLRWAFCCTFSCLSQDRVGCKAKGATVCSAGLSFILLSFCRDDASAKATFFQHLVEDRSESASSYYEFLQHIQQQVPK